MNESLEPGSLWRRKRDNATVRVTGVTRARTDGAVVDVMWRAVEGRKSGRLYVGNFRGHYEFVQAAS